MNKHGSKWIRPEKRARIYARDEWRCVWCRRSAARGQRLTLDHYTPRSDGGSNEASNLLTACLQCNSRRRNIGVVEFAFMVRPTSLFRSAGIVLSRVFDALAKDLPVLP
jgi:5-methylcytosine-specific restriction endonuclease McrA